MIKMVELPQAAVGDWWSQQINWNQSINEIKSTFWFGWMVWLNGDWLLRSPPFLYWFGFVVCCLLIGWVMGWPASQWLRPKKQTQQHNKFMNQLKKKERVGLLSFSSINLFDWEEKWEISLWVKWIFWMKAKKEAEFDEIKWSELLLRNEKDEWNAAPSSSRCAASSSALSSFVGPPKRRQKEEMSWMRNGGPEAGNKSKTKVFAGACGRRQRQSIHQLISLICEIDLACSRCALAPQNKDEPTAARQAA